MSVTERWFNNNHAKWMLNNESGSSGIPPPRLSIDNLIRNLNWALQRDFPGELRRVKVPPRRLNEGMVTLEVI